MSIGHIRPTIVVVFGQHCRLENISPDGRRLQSEQFTYQGVETVRKAGEAVGGTLMREWRKLRQSHPELFGESCLCGRSQPLLSI